VTHREGRARAGAVVTWTAIGLLSAPALVSAHLVETGLGPVYDGVSHLLVSFDDLLPVVALALLAGLNGAAAGRRVLFLLPATWLGAGALGFLAGSPGLPYASTAASLLLVGALTALDRKLSPNWVGALAVAVGGLHGWLNGAALAQNGLPARALWGIGAAVFVLVALAAAAVSRLRAPAARIAIRVAGSWIGAIGLLYLGWSLR